MIGLIITLIVAGTLYVAVAWLVSRSRAPTTVRCTFDRNELGPKGDHGQWWWDVYKCEDGSERRVLVASPRG